MEEYMERFLQRCKCGAKARYRYKIPMHWIECTNKQCPYKAHTRYYSDSGSEFDVTAKDRAVAEWTKMVLNPPNLTFSKDNKDVKIHS